MPLPSAPPPITDYWTINGMTVGTGRKSTVMLSVMTEGGQHWLYVYFSIPSLKKLPDMTKSKITLTHSLRNNDTPIDINELDSFLSDNDLPSQVRFPNYTGHTKSHNHIVYTILLLAGFEILNPPSAPKEKSAKKKSTKKRKTKKSL